METRILEGLAREPSQPRGCTKCTSCAPGYGAIDVWVKVMKAFAEKFVTKFTRVEDSSSPSSSSYCRRMCMN